MSSNTVRQNKVQEEVDELLWSEGFVVNTDSDRLQHLLSVCQSTKDNLKSAHNDTTLLQNQFADATKQFESYVEHITKLSDEREALAVELQVENKELKEKINKLTMQLATYDDRETRDMLLQIGLDDIVNYPPREQIAYLLVERARLLDELEEAHEVYQKTTKGHMLNGLSEQQNGYGIGSSVGNLGHTLRFGPDEGRETSWCKLKDLLEKVDELETTNDHLMQRLKTVAPEEYAELVAMEKNAGGSQTSTPRARPKMADFVRKQPFVPPKDLQEAITRLEAAEEKAAEAEFLRMALKEKERMPERHFDDTINDEESFASLVASPRGGATATNRDLQSAMAAVDAHLQQLLLNSSAGATGLAPNSAGGEASAGKFSAVQKDFERVKSELVKMMDKYNAQHRKYADHKLATRNKLHSVKEGFRRERAKLTEDMERLENELALMKVTVQKELEYRENMEKSHHSLLMEQRDLQTQLAELEDRMQQKSRELASTKAQLEYVEADNADLRQCVDSLNKQKNNLDQSDRHRINVKISSTVDGVEAFVNNSPSTADTTNSSSFGMQ